MPDKDNMNIFKCHCNYHLGMGPNLQCPVHGSRENLFAGVVSRRSERERTRADHLVVKDDLEWEVKRLRKLLDKVSKITKSRVIRIMIEQGLDARTQPYELGSMTRVKESVIAEMENGNRATINGIIILAFGGVIIGGLLLMLFRELGWIG